MEIEVCAVLRLLDRSIYQNNAYLIDFSCSHRDELKVFCNIMLFLCFPWLYLDIGLTTYIVLRSLNSTYDAIFVAVVYTKREQFEPKLYNQLRNVIVNHYRVLTKFNVFSSKRNPLQKKLLNWR